MSKENKPWERPWTTQEIVDNATNWSLAADVGLLKHLEDFSENLLNKVNQTNDNLNNLLQNLTNASLSLDIARNEFLSLSNTQFIESRVYEDDETLLVTTENEKADGKKQIAEERLNDMKMAVMTGLDVVDKYFDKVEVPASDTEDETDFPSFVLRPKDMYADRPLPYVIGTDEWYKKMHVGLEESSSDSETEKVSEKYSDTDSESDLPITDRSQIKSISESESEADFPRIPNGGPVANSTFNNTNKHFFGSSSSEEFNSVSAQAPISQNNFVEQLAAKLGNVVASSVEVPEPEVNKRPIQRPSAIGDFGNIFLNEPPPLDEDDIFHGKSSQHGVFSGGDGLFDDLDDDVPFWDEKKDVVKEQQPNRPEQSVPNLFDDEDDAIFVSNVNQQVKKDITDVKKDGQKSGALFDDDFASDDDLFSTSSFGKRETKPRQYNEPGKTTQPLFNKAPPAPNQTANDIKKKVPVGGISIYGNILAGEKITKLLKSQRHSSESSDTFSEAENLAGGKGTPQHIEKQSSVDADSVGLEPEKLNDASKVTTDLATETSNETIAPRTDQKQKVKSDLWDSYEDTGDIFSNIIKKQSSEIEKEDSQVLPESRKNLGLFDNDTDIFDDILSSMPKKKFSSGLFDDPDPSDLLNPKPKIDKTRTSLFEDVVFSPKTLMNKDDDDSSKSGEHSKGTENSRLDSDSLEQTKEFAKNVSVPKENLKTLSLFDDDDVPDDDFLHIPDAYGKPQKDLKPSLFSDDSMNSDDLFSDTEKTLKVHSHSTSPENVGTSDENQISVEKKFDQKQYTKTKVSETKPAPTLFDEENEKLESLSTKRFDEKLTTPSDYVDNTESTLMKVEFEGKKSSSELFRDEADNLEPRKVTPKTNVRPITQTKSSLFGDDDDDGDDLFSNIKKPHPGSIYLGKNAPSKTKNSLARSVDIFGEDPLGFDEHVIGAVKEQQGVSQSNLTYTSKTRIKENLFQEINTGADKEDSLAANREEDLITNTRDKDKQKDKNQSRGVSIEKLDNVFVDNESEGQLYNTNESVKESKFQETVTRDEAKMNDSVSNGGQESETTDKAKIDDSTSNRDEESETIDEALSIFNMDEEPKEKFVQDDQSVSDSAPSKIADDLRVTSATKPNNEDLFSSSLQDVAVRTKTEDPLKVNEGFRDPNDSPGIKAKSDLSPEENDDGYLLPKSSEQKKSNSTNDDLAFSLSQNEDVPMETEDQLNEGSRELKDSPVPKAKSDLSLQDDIFSKILKQEKPILSQKPDLLQKSLAQKPDLVQEPNLVTKPDLLRKPTLSQKPDLLNKPNSTQILENFDLQLPREEGTSEGGLLSSPNKKYVGFIVEDEKNFDTEPYVSVQTVVEDINIGAPAIIIQSEPSISKLTNISLFDPTPPPDLENWDTRSENNLFEDDIYSFENVGVVSEQRSSIFDIEPPSLLYNESSGIVRDQSTRNETDDSSFFPYASSSRRLSTDFSHDEPTNDSIFVTRTKSTIDSHVLHNIPEVSNLSGGSYTSAFDVTPSGKIEDLYSEATTYAENSNEEDIKHSEETKNVDILGDTRKENFKNVSQKREEKEQMDEDDVQEKKRVAEEPVIDEIEKPLVSKFKPQVQQIPIEKAQGDGLEKENGEKAKDGAPGKLKHSLTINVRALLPGAAPLRRNQLEKSKSLDFSQENEQLDIADKKFAPPVETSLSQSKLSNTASSDNSVEVLQSITKDRVRIPVKRRPSTRRGREAIRKSCIDFTTLTDAAELDEDGDIKPEKNSSEAADVRVASLLAELSARRNLTSKEDPSQMKQDSHCLVSDAARKTVGREFVKTEGSIEHSGEVATATLSIELSKKEKLAEHNGPKLVQKLPETFAERNIETAAEEPLLFAEHSTKIPKATSVQSLQHSPIERLQETSAESNQETPPKPPSSNARIDAVKENLKFTQEMDDTQVPEIAFAGAEITDTRSTQITVDNADSEVNEREDSKSDADGFLTIDDGLFGGARRTSFVKTDNFESPDFKKSDLFDDEDNGDDIFSEKKLPPKSDILKRSLFDDDDDDTEDIFGTASTATKKTSGDVKIPERRPKSTSLKKLENTEVIFDPLNALKK